jgi:GMP synthase (glutamine-hydrolysing)
MILLIQICKETFHYFEFVKPIEDILNKMGVKFISVNYKDISEEKLLQADKVIICGTSLKDNGFLDDVNDFFWIKNFNKPIFGICGGMHILGLVFDGKLKKQQEIGLTTIKFDKEFFGMEGAKEVYELHNFYAESSEFEFLSTSKYCPQAMKHKHKPCYAVLFHPEVRNKELIENFIRDVQFNA